MSQLAVQIMACDGLMWPDILRSAAPAEFVTHLLVKPQVSAVQHDGGAEFS
jgi:hypothetical protein